MALVVETGSIVANANAYNSEAEVVAHAAIFDVTMTTQEAEKYVKQGRCFLDNQYYKGGQVSFGTQSLPWPRNYVYVEGNLLDNDAIPTCLKKAECELALALKLGYDPVQVVSNENQIKEEHLGPIGTTYKDNSVDVPIIQKLNMWLAPLLQSGGGTSWLERVYG